VPHAHVPWTRQVVDGLVSICRQYGVDIRTDTPVAAIRSSSGVVTGVQLQDGAVLPAATVVTNRDVSMSWPLLVDEPRAHAKQRQLAAKQYSAGVVAFYWCLSKRLDKLSHHNVFLSGARACAPHAPCDYMGRTRQSVPLLLPHTVHLAHTHTHQVTTRPRGDVPRRRAILCARRISMWRPRRAPTPQRRLQTATRSWCCCLSPTSSSGAAMTTTRSSWQQAGSWCCAACRQQETVREPAQWRQLHGLEHGAAFGMSHGLTQLALLRPGAVDPGAPRGLFFVGASSRPGNGVPLVMLGAQQTAKRILRARA
jgi:phytoene desaturase (3,4-didehydrolycopene-forming)